MPIELQIIRANEFVRVDPRGCLNFEESKEALASLARACQKRGLDRAVLDLRTVPIPARPLFTVSELTALVSTFRESGFVHQERLAVLYQKDPHRGIRRFAFISRMGGMQVRAFADFEEALVWLAESPDTPPVRNEEETVPIKSIGRELKPKRRAHKLKVK